MQRLEVSGAVRPLQWSLGVKRLKNYCFFYGSTYLNFNTSFKADGYAVLSTFLFFRKSEFSDHPYISQ